MKVTTPPASEDTPPRAGFGDFTDKTARGSQRKATPGRAPGTGGRRTSVNAYLEAKLAEQFRTIGITVYALNQVDGRAILEGHEKLASSLVAASEQSPKLRRALELGVTGGVWGELAFAVANIAIPIMMNHNVIPPVPFMAIPETEHDGSGNGSVPDME